MLVYHILQANVLILRSYGNKILSFGIANEFHILITIINQVLNISNRILFSINIFLCTLPQEISCFLLHDNHGYVMLQIIVISISWEGDQQEELTKWNHNELQYFRGWVQVLHELVLPPAAACLRAFRIATQGGFVGGLNTGTFVYLPFFYFYSILLSI